ncbi:MAG: hypothetical protein AAGE94_09070 [Acidobacteriota bacterium]
MPPTVAVWLVNLFVVYAAIGLLFGIAFVTRGAGRVDPTAADGTWGFRLLILPGAAALWPLLALRWSRANAETTPPTEDNAHRRAAHRRAARGATS